MKMQKAEKKSVEAVGCFIAVNSGAAKENVSGKKYTVMILARLEQIFDAKPGTAAGDELEVLAILIEHFENQRFPIDLPDPVEAIQFRMEQLGLKQNDLAKLVGSKSHFSEVLNRKRKLTLEMIRRLSKALAIPAEVLIQTY
jgi:HTH-type transcriptional regulator / antitoxin HigA